MQKTAWKMLNSWPCYFFLWGHKKCGLLVGLQFNDQTKFTCNFSVKGMISKKISIWLIGV
jgi:hypothetical protein